MTYVIDLRLIEGDGAFPCPKCGSEINPEKDESYSDFTDDYSTEGKITQIDLKCAKCRTEIKIIGF